MKVFHLQAKRYVVCETPTGYSPDKRWLYPKLVRRPEIRSKNPLAWLLIKLLGFFSFEVYAWDPLTKESIEYKRVEFDADNFVQQFLEGKEELERLYYQRVGTVVVGRDLFPGLMQREPMGFRFNLPLDGLNGIRVCGVTVKFIPWMEGCILLPEDF